MSTSIFALLAVSGLFSHVASHGVEPVALRLRGASVPFVAPNCASNPFSALDGCAAAPASAYSATLNFKDTTLLTDGAMIQDQDCSTAVKCPGITLINWNPAGIAYYVGFDKAKSPDPSTGIYCNNAVTGMHCSTTPGATNLIDATQYPWGISDPGGTNCNLNGGATGSGYNATTGIVRCGIGANGVTINLAGFDWSPNEGHAGENCLALSIYEQGGSNASGLGWTATVNFVNNHWKMLDYPGCTHLSGISSGNGGPTGGGNGNNGQSSIFQFLNYGGAVANPDLIDVNFFNNTLDGGGGGSALWIKKQKDANNPAIVTVSVSGKITQRYNNVHDIGIRVLDTNGGCRGIERSYNVVHNMGFYVWYTHMEMGLSFPNGHSAGAGSIGGCHIAYFKAYNNTTWDDASIGDQQNFDSFHLWGAYDTTVDGDFDEQLNIVAPNLMDHYATDNLPATSVTGPTSGTLTLNDQFLITDAAATALCSHTPQYRWTGSLFTFGDYAGTCNPALSISTFYAATCQVSYSSTCAGAPTGVTIKNTRAMSQVGNPKGIDVSGKGGTTPMTITGTLRVKNNFSTTLGTFQPPSTFNVIILSDYLQCNGGYDYGPGDLGNIDIATGLGVAISYSGALPGARHGCGP